MKCLANSIGVFRASIEYIGADLRSFLYHKIKLIESSDEGIVTSHGSATLDPITAHVRVGVAVWGHGKKRKNVSELLIHSVQRMNDSLREWEGDEGREG